MKKSYFTDLVTSWELAHQRRYDMNGRSQMQGGKNKCKPVLLRLSLAGNLEKPLLSLYGTEWRERGYGLRMLCTVQAVAEWGRTQENRADPPACRGNETGAKNGAHPGNIGGPFQIAGDTALPLLHTHKNLSLYLYPRSFSLTLIYFSLSQRSVSLQSHIRGQVNAWNVYCLVTHQEVVPF